MPSTDLARRLLRDGSKTHAEIATQTGFTVQQVAMIASDLPEDRDRDTAPTPRPAVRDLLAEGLASPNAGTKAAAERARKALSKLRELVERDAAEKARRARVTELRAELAKLAPRPAGGAGARARTRELANVRAWAKADGREVAARGVVPAPVIDAFNAAHPNAQVRRA